MGTRVLLLTLSRMKTQTRKDCPKPRMQHSQLPVATINKCDKMMKTIYERKVTVVLPMSCKLMYIV